MMRKIQHHTEIPSWIRKSQKSWLRRTRHLRKPGECSSCHQRAFAPLSGEEISQQRESAKKFSASRHHGCALCQRSRKSRRFENRPDVCKTSGRELHLAGGAVWETFDCLSDLLT